MLLAVLLHCSVDSCQQQHCIGKSAEGWASNVRSVDVVVTDPYNLCIAGFKCDIPMQILRVWDFLGTTRAPAVYSLQVGAATLHIADITSLLPTSTCVSEQQFAAWISEPIAV